MTKVAIKSERLTPFGGIFSIVEQFDSNLSSVTSRIKAFVFRFISVPAKWIKTSRQYVLNIYSCNNAYANVFLNDFG